MGNSLTFNNSGILEKEFGNGGFQLFRPDVQQHRNLFKYLAGRILVNGIVI